MNEWRLMPDLVGMHVERARTELTQLGFTRADRLSLQWVDEPGCKPLHVCRTYPEALQGAGLNSSKVIYVGRDPDAKRPDRPRKPSESTVEPDAPVPAPTPTTAGPEPFF